MRVSWLLLAALLATSSVAHAASAAAARPDAAGLAAARRIHRDQAPALRVAAQLQASRPPRGEAHMLTNEAGNVVRAARNQVGNIWVTVGHGTEQTLHFVTPWSGLKVARSMTPGHLEDMPMDVPHYELEGGTLTIGTRSRTGPPTGQGAFSHDGVHYSFQRFQTADLQLDARP